MVREGREGRLAKYIREYKLEGMASSYLNSDTTQWKLNGRGDRQEGNRSWGHKHAHHSTT